MTSRMTSKHNRLFLFVLFLLLAPALACTIVSDTLTFTPATLPEATVGQDYTAVITLSGNRTPINTVSVSEGELPPGIELHWERGADGFSLSGVPTQAGTYTFQLYVSCLGTNVSGQNAGQGYKLVVK